MMCALYVEFRIFFIYYTKERDHWGIIERFEIDSIETQSRRWLFVLRSVNANLAYVVVVATAADATVVVGW